MDKSKQLSAVTFSTCCWHAWTGVPSRIDGQLFPASKAKQLLDVLADCEQASTTLGSLGCQLQIMGSYHDLMYAVFSYS